MPGPGVFPGMGGDGRFPGRRGRRPLRGWLPVDGLPRGGVRGAGTPPYGCNSCKRGRGGIYAAREFMRDAVLRLLFFFQHWAGHTVENVSSLPGMDV